MTIGELFSAPFDVVLSFTDVVVPDLIYLSKDRAHLLTAKNLQGAQDLVVEVLSPSTKPRDERLKRDLYERVAAVLFEKDGVVTTPLLPHFELPLARVLGMT